MKLLTRPLRKTLQSRPVSSPMLNEHIDVNIDKTITASTRVGISQDPTPRCTVALSLKTANRQLGCPPPLHKYQVISLRIRYQQLSLCWSFRTRAASVSHGVSRRGLFWCRMTHPNTNSILKTTRRFKNETIYTFTHPHEPLDN